MKKRVCLLLLLSLFLINFVSAVDIELSKEVYSPGETLQGEIFGYFPEGLNLEDIHFYRDRELPVVFDILKLQDRYLIYAVLPYTEGAYSMKIEDTVYSTETGTSNEEVVKDFSIEPANDTLYSVTPGFIVSRGEDFFLTVKANKNTDVEGVFEVTGETQTVSLVQNKEKKIHFSVPEFFEYTESSVSLAGYSIPIIIVPSRFEGDIIKETGKFRFNPSEIKASILKDDKYLIKIDLLNLGSINISDITISSESDEGLIIEIDKTLISSIGPNEEESIGIKLSSEGLGEYSGEIMASSPDINLSAVIPLEITIIENETEVSFATPVYTNSYTCSDLGGIICEEGKSCSGAYIYASDSESCCDGECINNPGNTDTSFWVYGIVIFVLVAAAIAALWYFMKKKQKTDPNNLLKKRQEGFEKRMGPSPPPSREIRGGLTKV